MGQILEETAFSSVSYCLEKTEKMYRHFPTMNYDAFF